MEAVCQVWVGGVVEGVLRVVREVEVVVAVVPDEVRLTQRGGVRIPCSVRQFEVLRHLVKVAVGGGVLRGSKLQGPGPVVVADGAEADHGMCGAVDRCRAEANVLGGHHV